MSVTPADSSDEPSLAALESGQLYRFSDWPNPDVPHEAFGVYAVWLPDARLLYVGMGGKNLNVDPEKPRKRKGLWSRLNAHASGLRSGNQFCLYVCDRFIVRVLARESCHSTGSRSNTSASSSATASSSHQTTPLPFEWSAL